MKLVAWLLALHLLAVAVACGVAIPTDREATKMMAWAMALLVAGWASILASSAFLLVRIIRGRAGARDVVMCVILTYIGTVERNEGAQWYDYLESLPG